MTGTVALRMYENAQSNFYESHKNKSYVKRKFCEPVYQRALSNAVDI